MQYKVAVASSDGKVINQHFGRAELFGIFEVDADSGEFRLAETRETPPLCQEFSHDESRLETVSALLSDCAYVLVQCVGPRVAAALEAKGIHVLEAPDSIPEALTKLNRYHKVFHKLL